MRVPRERCRCLSCRKIPFFETYSATRITGMEEVGNVGGRAAQPIALIKAKGKTHMSKAQMKEREEHEIKVDMTDVKPPAYLTAKQKELLRRSPENS